MKVSFLLLSLVMPLGLSACQTPSQATVSSDNIICSGGECEWTAEEIAEMEKKGEMMEEETSTEAFYINYSKEAYDSMLGQEPFALFFHASWCPTCQFMEQDILSNSKNFPEGSIILKADYDTEIALKEKYNIYSQSLVVMINADGSASETLVAPSASSLASVFTKLLQ